LIAAEEPAVFLDSFSLIYFAITSRMGTVLIWHPLFTSFAKSSGAAIYFVGSIVILDSNTQHHEQIIAAKLLTLSAEIKAFDV
jgi:hypothetical protein